MAIPFKQAARGNYLPGRAGKVEYIVVHYTGIPSDTAENNAVYSAREYTGVSAHYFVDEREVWQSVRDEDTAYHCGSTHPKHPACRNYNSIGVEMCDSVGGVPEAVRARTAAFVRQKMAEYGIDVDHVLTHYLVTGKRCPAPWVDNPSEWETFKAMLEGDDEEVTQEQFDSMMDNYLARRNAKPADDWAKPYIQDAIDAGAMTDVGGTIERPQGFITRQEIAVVAAALSKK